VSSNKENDITRNFVLIRSVCPDGAASDLNWTSAAISSSGSDWINVKFTATEGDFHWVIYDDLAGAYQYFINRALPTLGEFRTLWRLSNTSFPRGRTNVKDDKLPALAEYLNATNVQDETWQKSDGTYLTKYDWSAFLREQDYHGVYGSDVGSWYIAPGKDYYNGDHLKQELMVHRESKTGDTVHLNMLHGTHYQATSRDAFAPGKTWGPWLWYLNNGSQTDAAARVQHEEKAWPYQWFKDDAAYTSRGTLQGRLKLSDGRPASNAAVFIGDNRNSSISTLDQGQGYYYTTYADSAGRFSLHNIRAGTYALYAWAHGAPLGDVTTNFTHDDVTVRRGEKTDLKILNWEVGKEKKVWQIGDWDRVSDGFGLADPEKPFEHARISKCPANLTYAIGASQTKDWCFGQSALGTWSISFPLTSNATSDAKLLVSLAGYSQGTGADVLVNGAVVGQIKKDGLVNSQDTYRGATRAGEWRVLEYKVGKEVLKKGGNEVAFKVTEATKWRGWIWDSVVLKWV
jgi:rhamnogalacturonan endolyase